MNRPQPTLFGIVNITEDSFSDGGKFLDPDRALSHAIALSTRGADVIDLGPASSHPDSRPITADEEIRRVAPVLERLKDAGIRTSVDTSLAETQTWCIRHGVDFVNDIRGFPDPDMYPVLADSRARLIVMHSIQREGRATRTHGDPATIVDKVRSFFTARVAALELAGIERGRLILDPGTGFFLGSNPEPSIEVLRSIRKIRDEFQLPLMVSVSRKSFLGSITGRNTDDRGGATLGAELFAAGEKVDYIRTHDVASLRDALTVVSVLMADS